jgi:O-antigen/teichoic acid export membrane protein
MTVPTGIDGASAMRRDIASAYAAAGSRIGSWVIVSALVYRFIGPAEFAMLALVRGTIGLLNYTTLGLSPAFIHRASEFASLPRAALPTMGSGAERTSSHAGQENAASRLQLLYSNALAIALLAGLAGVLFTFLYGWGFERLYDIPFHLRGRMWGIVLPLGIGTMLRLMGDAPGALLQVRNRIALDNLLLSVGDLLWITLAVGVVAIPAYPWDRLTGVAGAYAISGAGVFFFRFIAAGAEIHPTSPQWKLLRGDIARSLLTYGILVVAAQLADYLYAPTDYILIDRLLSPIQLAFYAPAVQIDAGLLLLVTGLSAVLLPKAAIAHAQGSTDTVRQYYLRGTLASAGLLSLAALAVYFFSPWIFRLWLGNPMPATQAILPLILIHTVVGGSSAVGRSILLAVGKVRPFTVAVLIAGTTNVVCSYAFVHYFHWGLAGIVMGTIVAVVGRCAIWMPWYTLRTLRGDRNESAGR